MSVYSNPQYFKGPIPQLVTMKALVGQSWHAGAFLRNTATGVALTTAITGKAQYLSAEQQLVDTTANEEVKLYKIPSSETQFAIYATRASADAVANKNLIGQNIGIAVNSCIVTAAPVNTSHAFLHVENIMQNVAAGGRLCAGGSSETATGTTPGILICSVVQSVLDGDAG